MLKDRDTFLVIKLLFAEVQRYIFTHRGFKIIVFWYKKRSVQQLNAFQSQ